MSVPEHKICSYQLAGVLKPFQKHWSTGIVFPERGKAPITQQCTNSVSLTWSIKLKTSTGKAWPGEKSRWLTCARCERVHADMMRLGGQATATASQHLKALVLSTKRTQRENQHLYLYWVLIKLAANQALSFIYYESITSTHKTLQETC